MDGHVEEKRFTTKSSCGLTSNIPIGDIVNEFWWISAIKLFTCIWEYQFFKI